MDNSMGAKVSSQLLCQFLGAPGKKALPCSAITSNPAWGDRLTADYALFDLKSLEPS